MAPVNRIKPSARAKTAIAASLIAAAAGGWHSLRDSSPTVHPPEVILAKEALVKTWEGVVLEAHWDPFAKIYDICYGKTTFNGKPIQKGMKFTRAQCEAMLEDDLYNDYYLKIVKQVPQYVSFPVSVKAAQLSGGYNFGVGAMVRSTAMKLALKGDYWGACTAQTAFNKAGGRVVTGLTHRREMGDAQRIGEAELCVSGL